MSFLPPMSTNQHGEWTREINRLEDTFRRLDLARIRSGNSRYPPTVINEMKRVRNLLDVIIYAHEEDAA